MDVGTLTGQIELDDQLSSALTVITSRVKQFAENFDNTFGKLAVVAGVAATAIAGTTASVIALGNRGSDINDLTSTLERFTGGAEQADAVMKSLRSGTMGTVSNFDLMKSSTKLLAAEVKLSAKNFETMSQAAFVLQNQGLGPTKDMLDMVSNALLRGQTRMLEMKIGKIDLSHAEVDYAKTLGISEKSLTDVQQLEAKRIGILAALETRVQAAGKQQRDFGEQMEYAVIQIKNWGDALSARVASSTAVTGAVDAIGAALKRTFGGTSQTLMDWVVKWIDRFANAVAHYGPLVIEAVGKIRDKIIETYDAVKAAWDAVPDWFKNIAKQATLASVAVGGVGVVTSALIGPLIAGLGSLATMWGVFGDRVILAGTALYNAFGALKLIYSIGGLQAVLHVIGLEFSGIALAVKGITAAMVTNPVTLFIAALAAGAGAIRLATGDWDHITKPIGRVLELFRDIYTVLKDRLTPMIEAVADRISNLLSPAWSGFLGMLDRVMLKLQLVIELMMIVQGRQADWITGGTHQAAEEIRSQEKQIQNLEAIKRLKLDVSRTGLMPGAMPGSQFFLPRAQASTVVKPPPSPPPSEEVLRFAEAVKKQRDAILGIIKPSKEWTEAIGQLGWALLRLPKGGSGTSATFFDNLPMHIEDLNAIPVPLAKILSLGEKLGKLPPPPLFQLTQQLPGAYESAGAFMEEMTKRANEGGSEFGKTFVTSLATSVSNIGNVIVRALEGGGNVMHAVIGSLANDLGKTFSSKIAASVTESSGAFQGALAGGFISGWMGLMSYMISEGLKPAYTALEQLATKAKMSIEEVKVALSQMGAVGRQVLADLAPYSGSGGFFASLKKQMAGLSKGLELTDLLGQFPTQEELQKVADNWKVVYDSMLASGKYTTTTMAEAWKRYQDAVDAALGAAAPDWGGFSTRAELEATAAAAEDLFNRMTASGLFTAETLEQAWTNWQDALIASGDAGAASLRRIDAEMKSLEDSLAAEAWEEEIGSIEKAQRARLEALKEEKAVSLVNIAEQTTAKELAADEAQKAADRSYLHAAAQGKLLDDGLREMFAKGYEIPIWFKVGGTGAPSSVPGTSGAGKVQNGGTVTTVVQISGSKVAEIVVPYFPGAVQNLGLG